MRERSSHTTPRRRGPKQPLPREQPFVGGEQFECVNESPYYTIDNTEDIYGTTLLPSQRCYVDPWDLENYDYVRKKIDVATAPAPAEIQAEYFDNSLPSSPEEEICDIDAAAYGYAAYTIQRRTSPVELAPRMASTLPRPHTRHTSRVQCQLECCAPSQALLPQRRRRRNQPEDLYAARSELYGIVPSHYDDYMAHMTRQLNLEDDYMEQRQIYNGYGGLSSASSGEHHSSSIGSDEPHRHMQRRSTSSIYGYGTAPAAIRKRSAALKPKPIPPQIEFPAPPPPPPLSPAYDYCNPYSTLPYCSIPDCYECQQHSTSLIYAAPSIYGTNTLSRGQSASPISGASSLYAGIYSNKFALSKKGLLQIDYSCSWNDLDRVMGRNY